MLGMNGNSFTICCILKFQNALSFLSYQKVLILGCL